MTRAELEQVREAMSSLHEDQKENCNDQQCVGCKRNEKAIALIDAELAKPEAREWRVVVDYGMPSGQRSYGFQTERAAQSFAEFVAHDNPARTECRTGDGPWKAVKSIGSVLLAALVIAPVLAVCMWGGN